MTKPWKISTNILLILFGLTIIAFSAFQFIQSDSIKVKKGSRIMLIGNNLGSRMMNYDNFETEMRRVLIHGLLHLMGYQDSDEKLKSEMRAKEDQYLLLF